MNDTLPNDINTDGDSKHAELVATLTQTLMGVMLLGQSLIMLGGNLQKLVYMIDTGNTDTNTDAITAV